MIPYKLTGDLVKSKKHNDSDNNIELQYVEGSQERTKEYFQQSFWELTDEEINDIVKTKTIALNVFGFQYPPISIQSVKEDEFEYLKESLTSQMKEMLYLEKQLTDV